MTRDLPTSVRGAGRGSSSYCAGTSGSALVGALLRLDEIAPTADGGGPGLDLLVARALERVVLAVRVRGGELGGRHGLDAVLVEEPGQTLEALVLFVALAAHAARVRRRLDLERGVGLVVDPEPALLLVERTVDLDVLAVGEAHDPAGLVAVEHELTVLALQAQADALGDPEREPGTDEEQDPEDPRDRVDRQREVRRDEVVRPGERQDDERREERDAQTRADRDVPRAVEHVVLALVLRHRSLEERVGEEEREQQAR